MLLGEKSTDLLLYAESVETASIWKSGWRCWKGRCSKMASVKDPYAEALAQAGITSITNTGTAGQQYTVNPAGITQSFYTTPTTRDNYEQGRPVYSQSDAVRQASEALTQHQQGKPGDYQSAYGDQIQDLINQIMSREKFNYDFAADPLYQQYAEQYQRQGRMAMKDAMAESASLTGGYGNSYAQQVGQQTYQGYMQNLGDVIPGLRDAAYQAYLNEGEAMRGNLGMLQGQDASDYGRYRDTMNDWQNELNFYYNMYNDMSQAEYNRYVNDAAAWEADRAYWASRADADQAQANWEKEFALASTKSSSSKKTMTKAKAAPIIYPDNFKDAVALTGLTNLAKERGSESYKRDGYTGSYSDYVAAMVAQWKVDKDGKLVLR
jgi:hypothetical protein